MTNKSIQYDGILIRASLDDTGQIPRSMALQESPDTIPYGANTIEDPSQVFTETYDENVSEPLVADRTNVVYIRGKNLGDFKQAGKAYLYWSLEADLDDPSQWQNNQLLTIKGSDTVTLPTTKSNKIVVTETPFEWIPDASLADTTVILIGVVATNEHPNPVPGLESPIDFDRWISRQGGVGVLQATVEAPPEVSPSFDTSASYALKNDAGMVTFTLRAKNCPIGSTVSFISSESDAAGKSIELKPIKINTNPFVAPVNADVAAGFTTQINFKLVLPEGELADEDNEVSLEATQIPTQGTAGGPVIPKLLAKYATQMKAPTQAT